MGMTRRWSRGTLMVAGWLRDGCGRQCRRRGAGAVAS
eukprot:gene2216-15224_t